MRTAIVITLGVLALAAGAFLLLRKDGKGFLGWSGSAERDAITEEERALLEASPHLQGNPGGPRPRTPDLVPERVPTGTHDNEVLLRVHVVDDATGAAIPRAQVWLQVARTPCPRMPEPLTSPAHIAPGGESTNRHSVHITDDEGTVALGTAAGLDRTQRLEVFALAKGLVLGVACNVSIPADVTIRLVKGLTLKGRVTDRQGKRLTGAWLSAEPATGTPAVPGHGGSTSTGEDGRFEMEGLLAGALQLTVQREGFWPLTVENEDPADPRERTYVLTPAFVLKFRLRANDGREIVNPTLQATAAVRPPFSVVQILKFTEDKNNDGILTVGVPVPATLGFVSLEVKAEGYAAWRAPDVVVPPEGGEQVFPITLGRDTGQGGVRLKFEDERGQPVKYGEMNALPPTIQPLDRQDLAGGIVYEIKEDLRFPALPPGRYRFGMAAFAYAPASVEAVVFSGGEVEVRVPLRTAARLKVRFTAPTARTVRFRLTQGSRFVPVLPEKASTTPRDPSKPEEDAVLAAGEDGVVLGGLGSGTYVVEVLSEDLQASRTSVSVREGETEEIEIRVQPR